MDSDEEVTSRLRHEPEAVPDPGPSHGHGPVKEEEAVPRRGQPKPNKRQRRSPTTNSTPHEITVDVGQDVVTKLREWAVSSGSLEILSVNGKVSYVALFNRRNEPTRSFYEILSLSCPKVQVGNEIKFTVSLSDPTTGNIFIGRPFVLLASSPVKISVASFGSPTLMSNPKPSVTNTGPAQDLAPISLDGEVKVQNWIEQSAQSPTGPEGISGDHDTREGGEAEQRNNDEELPARARRVRVKPRWLKEFVSMERL
ncbi:uncharacterized protein LOC133792591 [Humulus lupulus]|uniref:uncharacterized protein LOC133792591 n=1 Tax=Humulus lupulus TaxID=3486 RepID=UPI002B403ADF|nr:uncharacterized protein LOC133792591 [Humulus lupulus]